MASALFFVFLYVLTFLQSSTPVKGIELLYCSPLNTGSDFDTVISDFQSNGRCRETCIGKYSFAILQAGSTTSLVNWYPLPIIIIIIILTFINIVCRPGNSDCYPHADWEPHYIFHLNEASLTTNPTSSETSSVSTQTIPGGIATITIPNNTPVHTSDPQAGSSNLNGGQIAGIVIGSLAGFGIIIALIFLIVRAHRRRERQRSQRNELFNPFHEPAVPTPVFRPHLTTEKPPAQSFLRVPNSRDTRLKNGIYPNGSRRSNVSLQDHQDYSRPVLRLTNPDPPSSD
ncbi:hypothetical protein CISG_00755 [Coccidioides immitis RMSCC 3703]|uniref:WSC domain-containing protein n=1 Tax=Coccidioides immitis RMSCC 3703 TaxID=454286 RepID=A0A0J8QRV9_COCIT|nr:hypothetical protein CISG_00755 [Coccidioides immitis RMSCC 3703]